LHKLDGQAVACAASEWLEIKRALASPEGRSLAAALNELLEIRRARQKTRMAIRSQPTDPG
jgi:hypothetical protein